MNVCGCVSECNVYLGVSARARACVRVCGVCVWCVCVVRVCDVSACMHTCVCVLVV